MRLVDDTGFTYAGAKQHFPRAALDLDCLDAIFFTDGIIPSGI